jgi:hypothetical protein
LALPNEAIDESCPVGATAPVAGSSLFPAQMIPSKKIRHFKDFTQSSHTQPILPSEPEVTGESHDNPFHRAMLLFAILILSFY